MDAVALGKFVSARCFNADPLTVRARDRVFLPFRMGGAGFLPFSRIGAGAFFASAAVSYITDARFASFDDFFKTGLCDGVFDACLLYTSDAADE